LLELMVIGLKGAGRCPAIQGLQHRRLHFQKAALIQEAAERRDDPGPHDKGLAHVGVYSQIHIPLAIALFLVGKGIEHLPILLFDHWQGFQGLGQQSQLVHQHSRFAGPGAEHLPCRFDKITQIQIPFEQSVRLFTHRVLTDKDLDFACAILDVGKRRLPHDSNAHQATDDGHPGRFGVLGGVRQGLDGLGRSMRPVAAGRVGIDPRLKQASQFDAALALLIGEWLF